MRRTKCRVWWPAHLSSTQTPTSSSFLFGWVLSSSSSSSSPSPSRSFDIIVAFARSEASFSSIRSDLQGILHKTNEKLPGLLQDKCWLSILGYCSADSSSNGDLPGYMTEQNDQVNYPNGNSSTWTHQGGMKDEYEQWVCGCRRFDGLLECCRNNCNKSNSIQFVYGTYVYCGRKYGWIPRINHIHWEGQAVSHLDLHIVIYETPRYGSHHFSSCFWSASDRVKRPLRKPKWVENLHQKQSLIDLDSVVLTINCANAAASFFEQLVSPDRSTIRFVTLTWKLLAISVASLSTFLYIILQSLHLLISYGMESYTYSSSSNLFGHTWRNIRVRCYQIFYWPIFLHTNDFRSKTWFVLIYMCARTPHQISQIGSIWVHMAFHCSLIFFFSFSIQAMKALPVVSCRLYVARFRIQALLYSLFCSCCYIRSESCVEYAEKSSLRRHFILSNMAIDVFCGSLFGIALLIHANSACIWISTFASDITNYWLLISCARLMVNPAGFKLNSELAGVLGTLSLNAIQIWSTLWGSVHFLFIYIIKGLAISGIILGVTTSIALTIDMITILTVHLASLHWLISLLYSQQIRAIAALWRLFRGQKWNPLRQRLDSYNYTVEQHILGSLLFTPLLLLLPTTSAFYMFFTIMMTTITLIRMLMEATLSVIHATPYMQILHWFVRPGRFPRGIWFEISSVNHAKEMPRERTDAGRSSVLISCLHGYSLSIGQLVWPHYRYLCSALSRSSVASFVYGIFSGRSLPSPLESIPPAPGAGLSHKLPWVSIPFKEYWLLCHDAVFSCKPDYRQRM